MTEENKDKKPDHKHSWTEKFTHHDPGYARHHDEDPAKGKTSAAAMKDGEAHQETKWEKFESKVAKNNAKEETDDIWGHYKGPGH